MNHPNTLQHAETTMEISLNILFASIFVGSLYMTSEDIRQLSHNNPIQIKQRAVSTFVSCITCCILVYGWCTSTGNEKRVPVNQLLGLRVVGVVPAAVLPLALTLLLFLGALVCKVCEYIAFQRIDNRASTSNATIIWPTITDAKNSITQYFSTWPNIRTVVIAPVAEEFVFRACMAAVMLHSGNWSCGKIVFVLPLFFGVAHAHHFYRLVFLEKIPMKRALFQCLFQFTYTSLFGMYASFIFLRTGHLIGAILCHCFCNWNGFPDLGWLTDKKDIAAPYKTIIGTAYVVGIVAFCYGLWPMTTPSLYGSILWQ